MRSAIYHVMKTLLKFSLLSALIISGKLAKQPAPVAAAATSTATTTGIPIKSVVFVHHSLSSEPVLTIREEVPPQRARTSIFAAMF